MSWNLLQESIKKILYMHSFMKKKIVHTNLQLLYQCNFKCEICDYWKEPYKDLQRLSLSQINTISKKLNQIGPQVISIGGGEPCLYKDLVEVVRVLARYHFPVMICNGWFITPQLAKDLFNAGMYEISISVDYADPEKHDKQRSMKGAFERAINALRYLQENRTNKYQRVNMISVIMNDNLEDVEPLIQICMEMGITYLVTLYSDIRGTREPRKIAEGVSEHLLKLKKKYKHFVSLRGYLNKFSKAVQENGIVPCYTGRNLCNIDSQGNVSFCIDRRQDYVGNILTDDMNAIEKSLKNRYRSNDCHGCWTSCRGSIETLMYGDQKILNIFDYYQMTKPVSLGHGFN